MLVSYSDSEGSEDEQDQKPVHKSVPKTQVPSTNSNFAVDRSTGRIKVSLQSKPEDASNGTHEDEPAAKKPRLGTGASAFSGFNAMLPAPKRINQPATQEGGKKAPARKVFSLRTGAEPAFSRESDAELRELFAGQAADDENGKTRLEATIPTSIPKPSFAKPAAPAPAGKPFMFKPLSVARGSKKKKPAHTSSASALASNQPLLERRDKADPDPESNLPKKKISLFSVEPQQTTPSIPLSAADDEEEDEDGIIEDLGPAELDDNLDTFQPPDPDHDHNHEQPRGGPPAQSLDTIASDLNLTPAERRQLFGRRKGTADAASSAVNVVNFNTDAEYTANQQLIASGEQVQHNPVRAIASGKHSLRQLVSSAATQKDALEESFAQGRRNKREAGNKYGW